MSPSLFLYWPLAHSGFPATYLLTVKLMRSAISQLVLDFQWALRSQLHGRFREEQSRRVLLLVIVGRSRRGESDATNKPQARVSRKHRGSSPSEGQEPVHAEVALYTQKVGGLG